MGIYLNPGNQLFSNALHSQIYVDKSMLVAETNALVNTEKRYLCVSRPRRFGKTMTASMLCAYYGADTQSRELFGSLQLAQQPRWDKYLGAFDVIRIVMTEFLDDALNIHESLRLLGSRVLMELHERYPDVSYDSNDLAFSLARFYLSSGRQFVVVIDEWDAIFRKFRNEHSAQRVYLDFLNKWLKDKEYIALAYMTGILPVKKYGEHSALNMFDEYSMAAPLQLAQYTGFTDDEVKELCTKYHRDYQTIRDWYDGYLLQGCLSVAEHSPATSFSIYAPLSVNNAVLSGILQNYWNKTETYEALAEYIRMDYSGLKETVALLLDGHHIPISLSTYRNDMTSFTCKDDILALLIHLGYLGYDQGKGEVFIPNREIMEEFKASTKSREWGATLRT